MYAAVARFVDGLSGPTWLQEEAIKLVKALDEPSRGDRTQVSVDVGIDGDGRITRDEFVAALTEAHLTLHKDATQKV